MSETTKRVRGLWGRLAKRRSERRGDSGDRALRRKTAQAQRLNHERLDNKLPR